jgi:hypothetical protein
MFCTKVKRLSRTAEETRDLNNEISREDILSHIRLGGEEARDMNNMKINQGQRFNSSTLRL